MRIVDFAMRFDLRPRARRRFDRAAELTLAPLLGIHGDAGRRTHRRRADALSHLPRTPPACWNASRARRPDIQFIIHQGMGALGGLLGRQCAGPMTAFPRNRGTRGRNGFVFYKFNAGSHWSSDRARPSICARAAGRSQPRRAAAFVGDAPDFGTLTIQRRRWANGGHPAADFFGYMRNAKFTRRFMRKPSCALPPLRQPGLRLVRRAGAAALSADDRFASNLLPPTAILYFFLWPRPGGYSWADLPRVYAHEPAAVAGHHRGRGALDPPRWCSDVKTPFFCRIEGRTAAPATHLAIEIGLFVGC